MQLTQFYHRNQLHRLRNHPDFRLFELTIWLHTLARSLIAVFVPILLLKIGYSLGAVLGYYFVFNLIDAPLNFPVGYLITRIGARRVLILGTLAVILFFALLGVLPPHNWLLLGVLALLSALYDTLFWVSHIYIFIEANKDGLEGGETTGTLDSIRKFANVVGPGLGAILLLTGGKVSLVITSIVIFGASLIPAFRMRHTVDIPKKQSLSPKKFFKHPTERRNYVSLALFGIQNEVDDNLWPIFILLTVGTIGSVAAVPIIVSLTTALFSYLTGKLTKSYGIPMLTIGTILLVCTWILRLGVNNQIFYYVSAFMIGFFSLLVHIPLDGDITNRGKKIGPLAAAVYRNACSMGLRALMYGSLLLVVSVFKISFLAAAVTLFLMLASNAILMKGNKRKYASKTLSTV